MKIKGLGEGRNRHSHTKVIVDGGLVAISRGLSAVGNKGVIVVLHDRRDAARAPVRWPMGLYDRTYQVHISEEEYRKIKEAFGD